MLREIDTHYSPGCGFAGVGGLFVEIFKFVLVLHFYFLFYATK